jgi:formylglycine-generating enzyme required for sulfatase activity
VPATTLVPAAPVVATDPAAPQAARLRSADLLPAPFAWVEISGGSGTMATGRAPFVTLAIPTERYWMGKYPVTNAQYAKFIDADGYSTERWWTAEGWQARQDKNWTEPRFWTNSAFNGAEQPIVGVSWYEAVAFCQWLSEASGEKIMLPTEARWQYAAQGDDGRAYPWGRNRDAGRCNHNVGERGIGKTTPVRQYEGRGDSRFGVADMAGNVWEWCLTDYGNRTDDLHSVARSRVRRGGSLHNINAVGFRCDFREPAQP